MFIRRMRVRIRNAYDEFPRPFWILVGASFIDALGGALLFPFYSLYVTQRFGIGMTQVGIVYGLISVTDLLGSFVGGALTDRIGRKSMTIFGLIVSAVVTLLLGLANTWDLFVLTALAVGVFASVGGPARAAMVADMLPERSRAQGYAIMRVVFNLSVTIGPAIGGFLASRSYLLLFVADAIVSTLVAGIVFFSLPETRPGLRGRGQTESVGQTFGGYLRVLRDSIFLAFCAISILATIVYIQMNTTLGVYLRDVYGVATQQYGLILSLNAAMVVLFQFWVTRRIRNIPPFLAMALGVGLYALGFGMYGFVASYNLFLLAMVIITIGEMVVAPVAQAIVAKMAPQDMRGRYMAAFQLTWLIPGMVGPLLAGLVLDNLNPRWLWYGAGVLGLVATMGFFALHRRTETPAAEPVKAVDGAL